MLAIVAQRDLSVVDRRPAVEQVPDSVLQGQQPHLPAVAVLLPALRPVHVGPLVVQTGWPTPPDVLVPLVLDQRLEVVEPVLALAAHDVVEQMLPNKQGHLLDQLQVEANVGLLRLVPLPHHPRRPVPQVPDLGASCRHRREHEVPGPPALQLRDPHVTPGAEVLAWRSRLQLERQSGAVAALGDLEPTVLAVPGVRRRRLQVAGPRIAPSRPSSWLNATMQQILAQLRIELEEEPAQAAQAHAARGSPSSEVAHQEGGAGEPVESGTTVIRLGLLFSSGTSVRTRHPLNGRLGGVNRCRSPELGAGRGVRGRQQRRSSQKRPVGRVSAEPARAAEPLPVRNPSWAVDQIISMSSPRSSASASGSGFSARLRMIRSSLVRCSCETPSVMTCST